MSDELPRSNKQNQSLEARFASRPHVYARLQQIADMMDEAIARGCTADEAEARAMEQIQQLGRELLTDWGQASKGSPIRVLRQEVKRCRSQLFSFVRFLSLSEDSVVAADPNPSFRLLILDTPPSGGDPFSHPSGSSALSKLHLKSFSFEAPNLECSRSRKRSVPRPRSFSA